MLGLLGNKPVLTGILLVVVATGVMVQRLGDPDQTIPFHTIYFGQGGDQPALSVINDNVTWSHVWTQATLGSGRPVPSVDFNNRIVS